MHVSFLRSAKKDLLKLDKNIASHIIQKIEHLPNEPFGPGTKKLVGNELYRIRFGNYRIVYTVDLAAHEITIVRIAHRKDVYR